MGKGKPFLISSKVATPLLYYCKSPATPALEKKIVHPARKYGQTAYPTLFSKGYLCISYLFVSIYMRFSIIFYYFVLFSF